MLRWTGLALLAVTFLAACGNAAPSPSPPASGVEGVVLMAGGPVSPSVPATPRPWPGAMVTVYRGDLSGPVVAETKAARDGSFTIDLPRGDYILVARPAGATPERVTVASEGRATVKLFIHVP